MKITTPCLAPALAGLLAVTASAQVFVGSDNFDSGSDAAWAYFYRINGSGTSNGNLSFTNSRLDFTKGTGAGSYYLGWDGYPGTAASRSAASYTTSWVADVTLTSTFIPDAGNYADMGLQVAGANSQFSELLLYTNGAGNPELLYLGSGITQANIALSTATDVRLRFAWDAGTQVLNSYYSYDGSTYNSIHAFHPLTDWTNGDAANGFYMEVLGTSTATAAVGLGSMYADNFSVSAIPEPSTYAAFAGLGALGLALWRKRGRPLTNPA